MFLYQTLDAIDGKQARRTGSSNALGELFDHGCDSLSNRNYTLIYIRPPISPVRNILRMSPRGLLIHRFLTFQWSYQQLELVR